MLIIPQHLIAGIIKHEFISSVIVASAVYNISKSFYLIAVVDTGALIFISVTNLKAARSIELIRKINIVFRDRSIFLDHFKSVHCSRKST